MQFIKKNYEKILLGLVLAGLVVVAVFLLFLVASEKQRLTELREGIINRPVKPLLPPDLSYPEGVMKMAATPRVLNFSDSTHRLFNPERWQKTASGPLIKNPVGSELLKLEIARIAPLFFTVSLDSVIPSDTGVRYIIGTEDQASPRSNQRGKKTSYASKGEKKEYSADKKDWFVIQDIQGPPESPTALVLELSSDTDKPVSVSKEKPFRRVDGYVADLKYPPENNRMFLNRRANDPAAGKILVAGEEYNIVTITESEVVLLARNQKKWTIKQNPTP